MQCRHRTARSISTCSGAHYCCRIRCSVRHLRRGTRQSEEKGKNRSKLISRRETRPIIRDAAHQITGPHPLPHLHHPTDIILHHTDKAAQSAASAAGTTADPPKPTHRRRSPRPPAHHLVTPTIRDPRAPISTIIHLLIHSPYYVTSLVHSIEGQNARRNGEKKRWKDTHATTSNKLSFSR